jgi:hypothetical protein
VPVFKYFKRFVDDIFGIWIGTSAEWENFKLALPFKNLHWKTMDLALKADFLDLTLEIKNGHIVTKTYEKPTNLFLYIPPTSAHSPGVLKSIIFGNVHRYWYQNSNIDDYQCII